MKKLFNLTILFIWALVWSLLFLFIWFNWIIAAIYWWILAVVSWLLFPKIYGNWVENEENIIPAWQWIVANALSGVVFILGAYAVYQYSMSTFERISEEKMNQIYCQQHKCQNWKPVDYMWQPLENMDKQVEKTQNEIDSLSDEEIDMYCEDLPEYMDHEKCE